MSSSSSLNHALKRINETCIPGSVCPSSHSCLCRVSFQKVPNRKRFFASLISNENCICDESNHLISMIIQRVCIFCAFIGHNNFVNQNHSGHNYGERPHLPIPVRFVFLWKLLIHMRKMIKTHLITHPSHCFAV